MKTSTPPKTQNETGSSISPRYNTRSCAARLSHVGLSKATAKKPTSARNSKCKGKSAALSLTGPSVTGKNAASCAVRFATPNVIENKNNISSHFADKLIREKSLKSYLDMDIIHHIRVDEDICYDRPIKPVGARCQLCKLDLAFAPKNSSSESFQFNELPTAAVLSCGHCYHKLCLEAVFGTVEPPCVICLDCC